MIKRPKIIYLQNETPNGELQIFGPEIWLGKCVLLPTEISNEFLASLLTEGFEGENYLICYSSLTFVNLRSWCVLFFQGPKTQLYSSK